MTLDLGDYATPVRPPRERGGVAVGAIRLSSLTDNTSSPERQREIIELESKLVQADELIFTEELDISATAVAVWDRPDLKYYLENPHTFHHLIVWKMDRVCRNVLETAWLISWALRNGINIICNSPRLDLSTPLGRGIALFIGSIAEMESVNTKERIRDARVYMAKVARWPAGKPMRGFVKAPHPSGKGFMLDLDYAVHYPVNRRIISLFLSRELKDDLGLGGPILDESGERAFFSFDAITDKMEEEGHPPPAASATTGKKWAKATAWHPSAPHKLLTNESLRNYVIVNGVIQRDDEGEPLRYGPPQVTDDEWWEIQAELERRSNKDTKAPVQRGKLAFLNAVIKCVLCKSNLHWGGPVDTRKYTCNQRGCKGLGINAAFVEPYVTERFLAVYGSLEYTYVEETRGMDHRAELRDVDEALAELEKDRYDRGLFKGDTGARRYAELYAKLEARRSAIEAKPVIIGGRTVIHTGITYAARWEMSSDREKRQALLDAGAVLWVDRAIRRGHPDWESRLTFELNGPEKLHEQGHDDANAADNFA